MCYLKWIFFLNLCIFTGISLASGDRNQYPGVVALVSKDNQHVGTGFFVQPDMLATAFHVVYQIGDFSPIREALFFKDPYTNTLHPVTGIFGS